MDCVGSRDRKLERLRAEAHIDIHAIKGVVGAARQ
jgi:hypothetical protein